MAMAVVEAALRVRDADDRALEHLARVAHALRERAAQVQRERGIAVVREAAGNAALGLLGHYDPSTMGSTYISTRRFSARPLSVVLLEIGMLSPLPTMARRTGCTFFDSRYCATECARRSESDWLYCAAPTSSVWPATVRLVLP